MGMFISGSSTSTGSFGALVVDNALHQNLVLKGGYNNGETTLTIGRGGASATWTQTGNNDLVFTNGLGHYQFKKTSRSSTFTINEHGSKVTSKYTIDIQQGGISGSADSTGSFGSVSTDKITLGHGDGPFLTEGDDNILKVDSGDGTLELGARNSSYAHIQTDRSLGTYFAQPINSAGGISLHTQGTQAAPAIAFNPDTNTGIYQTTDNQISISVNNNQVLAASYYNFDVKWNLRVGQSNNTYISYDGTKISGSAASTGSFGSLVVGRGDTNTSADSTTGGSLAFGVDGSISTERIILKANAVEIGDYDYFTGNVFTKGSVNGFTADPTLFIQKGLQIMGYGNNRGISINAGNADKKTFIVAQAGGMDLHDFYIANARAGRRIKMQVVSGSTLTDTLTLTTGSDSNVMVELGGNISGSSTSTGSFGSGYVSNKLNIGSDNSTHTGFALDVSGSGHNLLQLKSSDKTRLEVKLGAGMGSGVGYIQKYNASGTEIQRFYLGNSTDFYSKGSGGTRFFVSSGDTQALTIDNSANVTINNGNFEVSSGNISGSSTSTGSFGRLEVLGGGNDTSIRIKGDNGSGGHVDNGEIYGIIDFDGLDDNGDYITGAQIKVAADSNTGAGDMPSRIQFYTRADGGSLTQAYKITDQQRHFFYGRGHFYSDQTYFGAEDPDGENTHSQIVVKAGIDSGGSNTHRSAWVQLRNARTSGGSYNYTDWLMGVHGSQSTNAALVFSNSTSMAGGSTWAQSQSLAIYPPGTHDRKVDVYKDLNVGVDDAGGNLKVYGNVTATGDIIAENYIVSSSVTYMTQSFSSGSTIFGDTGDDKHQFTGSLKIQSGSIDVTSTQSPNYGMRFVTSAGHQYFKIRNGNSETFPYGQLVINYSNNSSLYSFINMAGSYKLKITAGTNTSLGSLAINAHTAEIANFHGTNGLTVNVGNISGSATSTGSFGQVDVANKLFINGANNATNLEVIGLVTGHGHADNNNYFTFQSGTGLRFYDSNGEIKRDSNVMSYYGKSGHKFLIGDVNYGVSIGTNTVTGYGLRVQRSGSSGTAIISDTAGNNPWQFNPSGNNIFSGSSTSTGSFGSVTVGVSEFGASIADNIPIGLQIARSENSKLRLARNTSLGNYLDIVGGTGGAIYNINTSATQAHIFKIANSEIARIDSSGVSGSSSSTGSFGRVKSDFINIGGNANKTAGTSRAGLWISGSAGVSIVLDNATGTANRRRVMMDFVSNLWKLQTVNDGGSAQTTHFQVSTYNSLATFTGNVEPGTDNNSNLGSSTKRWANIHSADLHLSNEDTEGNEVDGTTGNWTIQEGEDDLFLLNRKNGKKYRFKLEEIT